MRIATFNVQNLRLRAEDGRAHLDGAVDSDTSEPARAGALAHADRMETAKVIAKANADIVALQEVFDLATLDFFHARFLTLAGATPYEFRYCKKGNDGRGLNVAALSQKQARTVKSHADKTGADLDLSNLPTYLRDEPIFRRDCLELQLDRVTLFICHFKAPYPDPIKAWVIRHAEARSVRRIIQKRFLNPSCENWIILGDFNEPVSDQTQSGSALDVLCNEFAVDLAHRQHQGENWTFEVPNTHAHTRPDRILVSPALATAYPDTHLQIIRSGMHTNPGSNAQPRASDHALIYADFPGL
ncbi:MAG: endonuclease/exonuclease/phosphatase family protein [Boseongicola sp.]|nr:endonuclease/exonuclease/phosphatase family protein [Boseongicola sp.]